MKPRKLLLLPLLLLATLSSCQKKTSSPAGSAGTGTTVSATSSTKPVDVCTTNSGTPLSDVAAANLDKAFDGTVKVTGIKGSDLYVEDQTGGGFIYAGKSTLPAVKVGDSIHVTGKIGNFATAGIYQIVDPTVTVEGSACKISDPVSTTIADIDSHRMSRVKVEGLSVTSVEKRTTGANDAFITVSDGTNTIDIYVSKRIATAARTAIDTELAKLAVGSTLTINGAFADYYKKPQIALTDASQIVVG